VRTQARADYSPPDPPTLALTLELPHAQMLRAYVASHAVPPADDPQAPGALPPLIFRDEALIPIPRLPDSLIESRQALVETSAIYPFARDELLQPVPQPHYFPVRELSFWDLPKEKDVPHVLPRGALADLVQIDLVGRDKTRTRTVGSKRVGGRGVIGS